MAANMGALNQYGQPAPGPSHSRKRRRSPLHIELPVPPTEVAGGAMHLIDHLSNTTDGFIDLQKVKVERNDDDEQSWMVDHETESHEATFNQGTELQRTLTSTSQVN